MDLQTFRQIHIPKLGIHGRLEPGARVDGLDEDGLPEDLQLLKALEALWTW